MNEMQNAAMAFHQENPYATEEQAKEAADIEFDEPSGQREFMTLWRKLHDQAARIRQQEFKTDVDRIWPEGKYG